MSLKSRIFDFLPELQDSEIIDSHKEVLDSINNFNELIPKEYSNYNLVEIIKPKVCYYHTGWDLFYKNYIRLSKGLEKVTFNNIWASKIAYNIMKINSPDYSKLYKKNRREMKVQFNKNQTFKLENNNSYNLFFANAQTYVRVLSIYMAKSENNNLLVIPRNLENAEIINSIDGNKLLFYDDFINEEIKLKYEKARQIFPNIFINNQDKLIDYFKIGSKSFYPFLKTGLRNVFYYLLPQAVLFYLVNEEILRKIKVKNVIGVRVRKIFDRAFYECAKNYDIKRYILLHSNIGKDINFIHGMGHFNNISGVFVWGEKQKQIIERDSFSRVDKLFVTGSPLFERPNFKPRETSNKVKKILYAATHNDFDEITELIRFVNNSSEEVHLTIKVHPGVDDKKYKFFSKYPRVEVFSGNKVLEDILPNYDLLVTTISESSLQGMLFRIPTLMLQINNRLDYLFSTLYDFSSSEKRVMVIENKENIGLRLRKIIFDYKHRDRHLKLQDSVLSKRILTNSEKNSSIKIIDKILV